METVEALELASPNTMNDGATATSSLASSCIPVQELQLQVPTVYTPDDSKMPPLSNVNHSTTIATERAITAGTESDMDIQNEQNIINFSNQNQEVTTATVAMINALDTSTTSVSEAELAFRRRGRKRTGRPTGRPKGSTNRRNLKTTPDIDPTKVYRRVNLMNKMKRLSKDPLSQSLAPGLIKAYKELEKVTGEKDEMEANVQKLQTQFDELQKQLEAAKSALKFSKEIEEHASKTVAELEMKLPCEWNEKFERLKAYKAEHGHCNLPTRCDDPELNTLCRWLVSQKTLYKEYVDGIRKTKFPHRIEALQNLGVRWNMRDDKWTINYNKLIQYKNEHGTTEVPTKHHPDRNFSNWIATQRYEYKVMKETRQNEAHHLTPERLELLNKIGFVFNVFDKKWNEMYDQLIEFRSSHGHVNVSPKYDANKPLARWVERQRMEYQMLMNGEGDSKKCRLTNERIKRLQDVDFCFFPNI